MSLPSTRRRHWFNLIESGFSGDRPARAIAVLIVALIVLNTIAVVLESHTGYLAGSHRLLSAFDAISVGIFTVEYLLRAWVAPEHPHFHGQPAWAARLRYLVSPIALVDLIAILPAYLSILMAVDLRYLRLLRLLRLLKLTHYFDGLGIFLTVVQSQARTLLSALFTLSVLVVVSASLMYALEHDAQPEGFGSIGQSVWWAVVTMTTVGYGDVTPITPAGRILATFIMLLGVGVVALPAGVLAARFAEELQARRDLLGAKLDLALKDGKLNKHEIGELTELSRELGVPNETLERMLHTRSLRKLLVPICPHCGKQIE